MMIINTMPILVIYDHDENNDNDHIHHQHPLLIMIILIIVTPQGISSITFYYSSPHFLKTNHTKVY